MIPNCALKLFQFPDSKIRFLKNHIFEIYRVQGISGCKNFPGQKVSGFQFLPKSPPNSIFVKGTLSGNVLGCLMLNFNVLITGIRFSVQ